MTEQQPEQSSENAAPGRRQGTDPSPAAAPSPVAGLAAEYAAKAGLHRTHDGRVDVLRSAGGVQGIAESIVPGLVFLVAFTVTRELTLSLVAALASAAAFTIARLAQRRPLTQALAGVVGVGISAWLANTTGKAEDFYLPGFFTNAAYILAMVVSIIVKWPVAGLLFGFIRNEGVEWRKDPDRVKAYRLGTWIIVAVLALRLIVQVPLYLMGSDGLAALATTRLIMGAPLYILGVWVAWLVTRPAPAEAEDRAGAGQDT
ncbi:DUF3159 domain-containing protein [Pseudarthrobacter sp. AG30]|uniref:DUF3159 domain-containing protein n=1 Tax=unclassified Pseudarthrobacter TaxID=2647000 RepID=UPI000D6E738F|nr:MULTISPECIES: DUF3159 domain-containing protein [unclassified Pseudarthrobacter]RAX15188.1 DUF3159 domain-containing protein [Pseudarthrobacter sp. AG30]